MAMPNWTQNTITVRGDKSDLTKFRKRVKGQNGDIDFNRIEQMPESLDIEYGRETDLGLACFLQSKLKFYLTLIPWFPEQYPDVHASEDLKARLLEEKPRAVELGRQAF
jgi:hypothetical protein